jgi:hypothetical protein
MPNGDRERRLLAVADDTARRSGMWLRSDARKYLRLRIETAEKQGRLRDETDVARAESSVEVLTINAMQVARLEPREEPELRQDDLDRAVAGLCPGFWPFC